ncbi:unnamed protein product [Sphagnum jensenii]|uniref:Secreted protein n=1 Tax=Sphagnum jensenii TaxID=128206 RepID=A0ABP1AHT9_9BRYO
MRKLHFSWIISLFLPSNGVTKLTLRRAPLIRKATRSKLLQRRRDRQQPKRGGGGNPQAGTSKLELPGTMESSAMEDRGDHPRSEAIAKVLRNSSRKL